MLALLLLFRRMGKEVVGSWGGDPFLIPRHYAFLPGLEELTPPRDFPPRPELMITFDSGSFDRLGLLEPNARAAARLIVVDHHASGERFGDIQLIDASAAASAVIVHELATRLDVPLDAEIATCLYTGLVTDTGSFKYRNTTPAIHGIAADLLAHGIAHDEVARRVFDTHPVGYLKLAGVALERAEVLPEVNLIWTWITAEDLAAHEIDMEDTEALIDLVRTADETEVACVVKGLPDGSYKVSLRSHGGVDVGSVAASLGGGGHAAAAGFTADGGDPRGAVSAVVARLPRTPR